MFSTSIGRKVEENFEMTQNEPLKKKPPRSMGPLVKNAHKTILNKQGSIIHYVAQTTRVFCVRSERA